MTYIDWTMNYQATREIRTFDVDAFINDVYNRFCGSPNEESREDLQALWNKVLTMPRGGDASLYPNAHGPRPALLEVWHKAGDFWRANGFSKPARLLCDQNGIVIDEETAQRIAAAKATIDGTDNATAAEATEAAAPSPTPRRKRDRRKDAEDCGRVVVPTGTESPSDATETGTDETFADDEDTSIITDNDTTDDPVSGTEGEGEAVRSLAAILSMMTRSKAVRELAKGFGILAALAIIWQTGLLIPFALIGGIAAGVVK